MDTRLAAIVDYGLGNLHSVQMACAQVGIPAQITSQREELERAALVILPGVGAFRDAMAALRSLDLVSTLRELAAAGKPIFGVCLGMQLLMSRSEEFGDHEGLDLIRGKVVRLADPRENGRTLKVPQVGWNQIQPRSKPGTESQWNSTALNGLEGTHHYFVHSFVVEPEDQSVVLAETRYGNQTFCSAVKFANVTAVQFHPERSGPAGLKIYQNLAKFISPEGIQ